MQEKEVLPTDEIKRLAALRRQQQAEISKDSNLVQVGWRCCAQRYREAHNQGARAYAATTIPLHPAMRGPGGCTAQRVAALTG